MHCRKGRLHASFIVLVVGLLALSGQDVLAQETTPFEIAATYTAIPEFFGPTCHGVTGSLAYNVTNWFGAVGEVSGCKGSGGSDLFGPSLATHKWFTYLAGPRVSYRRTFTPYAHVLVGGAHTSIENPFASNSDNAFAMTIGFGVDVRVSRRVGIRLVQLEYLRSDIVGSTQEHGRVQTGVVLALGK